MNAAMKLIAMFALSTGSIALAQAHQIDLGQLEAATDCHCNTKPILDLNVPLKFDRPQKDGFDYQNHYEQMQARRRGELADCSLSDVGNGDLNCTARVINKGVLIDKDNPCVSAAIKGAKMIEFHINTGC